MVWNAESEELRAMVDAAAVSRVLESTALDRETREYLLGSLADCEAEEEALDVRFTARE